MAILKRDGQGRHPVEIYYEDKGEGTPIVMIHGWPLSGIMFEYQVQDLLEAGFRVITYDRRGFGKSSRTGTTYDYDAMTDDLAALLDELDLQDVMLVGFSMGGGEVARYFTRHGGKRVTRAALVSSVVPSIVKTANNPDGVPEEDLKEIMNALKSDRQKFLTDFNKGFFGVSFLSQPVSDELMHYYHMVANSADPIATQETAKAWAYGDFVADAKSMNVPTLIVHGKEDETVPMATSADRAAKLIPNNTYKKYDDAPHGLFITHRKQLSNDLIEFAKMPVNSRVGQAQLA